MRSRGIDVDLNGTLKENFDEITKEITSEITKDPSWQNYRADVYQNPLFDFIMNM